jgi:hypothetical protein
MKERDKARISASITWFNQFFDGIRQLYEVIVDLLPAEFFSGDFTLSTGNYYFPRYKATPSIPPYYALMLEGRKCALQVVSVIDTNLIGSSGPFILEPSMIVVVHSQVDKYGWLSEFGLMVIKNQNVELSKTVDGIFWGKIKTKFQADFFAFQTQYDKFTDSNLKAPVQHYIIHPIIESLDKGFDHHSSAYYET